MADGGEGTTEALIEALDASIHSIKYMIHYLEK